MRRNKARLTENTINRIIKESVKKVINEGLFNNGSFDDFTIAINKIYKLVNDEVGSDSVQGVIGNYFFDLDNWDYDSKIVPCKYNETGMIYLLYVLGNFDIICLNKQFVDVKNSNNPRIAKLIKPFASRELCEKIYGRLFRGY